MKTYSAKEIAELLKGQLKGDEKRIAEMKESIKKDDFGLGTIDFNKLIPMPKELDIVAGSSTDKGLKAYSLFAEIYQLGTKRTKEELLNIPEKSEQAFLKYKKDIKHEELRKMEEEIKERLGALGEKMGAEVMAVNVDDLVGEE